MRNNKSEFSRENPYTIAIAETVGGEKGRKDGEQRGFTKQARGESPRLFLNVLSHVFNFATLGDSRVQRLNVPSVLVNGK